MRLYDENAPTDPVDFTKLGHKVKVTVVDHLDRYLATGQIARDHVVNRLNDFLESDAIAETILAIGVIITILITVLSALKFG